MQRKIRVLVGKPGLDGHDRGAKVVAAALRDDGMEVIYTGLHQTPEQIVEAATQEDVDVVALSILSGAHMTLFPDVLQLMRERGLGDRLLTGGGIIPPEDMETLARSGVGKLFGPGASTQDIAKYIRGWFDQAHAENGVSGTMSSRSAKPAVKAPPAAKSGAVAKRVVKTRAAMLAKGAAKPTRRRARGTKAAKPARARKAATSAGSRAPAARRRLSKPARKRR